MCDRAQLPAGLLADGERRRQRAPWPKQCSSFEFTPPAWAILYLETGSAIVFGPGVPWRTAIAPAQVVLVAGAHYRIAPSHDADLTIQHLRHPSSTAECSSESAEARR
jgi:hypothetical protein